MPITTPEPILPIAVIALDIDGTLVGDDLLIGPDSRAAIRAARERGIVVSLITGRMVTSALRFARELDLVAPIVGYQGALIREMPPTGSNRPGRLLVHTPLRAEVAREVVAWTRTQGLDPHLNHLERFVVRSDDPRAEDYSAFMGSRPLLADDLIGSIRHSVTKVMATGEPPLPAQVAMAARARFAGRAEVTVSHPRFLEFVAPGVSKGRAVRWLARRLGIPLGAVLAIGDQWNDIEMLAEVGHGTAMPTAPVEVQAVARYIAPPLAEEGVARMIEALVLVSPSRARSASLRLAEESAHRRASRTREAEVEAGTVGAGTMGAGTLGAGLGAAGKRAAPRIGPVGAGIAPGVELGTAGTAEAEAVPE